MEGGQTDSVGKVNTWTNYYNYYNYQFSRVLSCFVRPVFPSSLSISPDDYYLFSYVSLFIKSLSFITFSLIVFASLPVFDFRPNYLSGSNSKPTQPFCLWLGTYLSVSDSIPTTLSILVPTCLAICLTLYLPTFLCLILYLFPSLSDSLSLCVPLLSFYQLVCLCLCLLGLIHFPPVIYKIKSSYLSSTLSDSHSG